MYHKEEGKQTIVLINIDEVSLAGGVSKVANTMYYLYTGQQYWTLSPSTFNSDTLYANAWRVHSTGFLSSWTYVSSSIGIRPVINLSANTKIISGDGTAINPYVVNLP